MCSNTALDCTAVTGVMHMCLSSPSSLSEAEPEILLYTCISVAVDCSTRTDSLKHTICTTAAPAE